MILPIAFLDAAQELGIDKDKPFEICDAVLNEVKKNMGFGVAQVLYLFMTTNSHITDLHLDKDRKMHLTFHTSYSMTEATGDWEES